MAGALSAAVRPGADAEAGGDVGPGVAGPRLAGSVIAPAMSALSACHGRMSNAPSWSMAAEVGGAWRAPDRAAALPRQADAAPRPPPAASRTGTSSSLHGDDQPG